MKNRNLSFIVFLYTNSLYAQRIYSERTYDIIGLPDSDKISDSLLIALPLLFVGFLIAYSFMWSKNDTQKVSETSTNIGCFGIIIMAIGAFFLLPLFAWIEYIFVSIYSICTAIFVVGVIVYLIYSGINKK